MVSVKNLEDIGIDMTNSIYLPGEVYSSKNSKRIVYNKKLRKPKLLDSIPVTTYKLTHAAQYKKARAAFLELIDGYTPPYFITFTFIRKTKSKWDFSNLIQLPQDMMQDHGWLPGDDVNVMYPLPPLKGHPCFYDKELCGLVISVHEEFNKKNKVQP